MLPFIALIGLLFAITNPEKVTSLLPASAVTEDERQEITHHLSSIGEGVVGTSKTITGILVRLMSKPEPVYVTSGFDSSWQNECGEWGD